jgi:hypothetical protein
MEIFKHQRKLLGIITISFINFIIQRDLPISTTKESITNLPKIGAALFIFATFGNITLNIESINKRIEIGSIIRD